MKYDEQKQIDIVQRGLVDDFPTFLGTFFDVTNGAYDTRRSQHIGLDSIVR